jgi:hypothetical protein
VLKEPTQVAWPWEKLLDQVIPDLIRDPGDDEGAGMMLNVEEILRCGTGGRLCLTQDDIMVRGTFH